MGTQLAGLASAEHGKVGSLGTHRFRLKLEFKTKICMKRLALRSCSLHIGKAGNDISALMDKAGF